MRVLKQKSPFSGSRYLIHKGAFWDVILHRNQSYLGRSIIYLKRPLDDLMGLTPDERSELWDSIMPKLVMAIGKSFGADRINYAHLANTVNWIHWHVVPRYEEDPVKVFDGETFRDERVGFNYAPEPSKILPHLVMRKIYLEIKKHYKH